jgi:hypothetical protein
MLTAATTDGVAIAHARQSNLYCRLNLFYYLTLVVHLTDRRISTAHLIFSIIEYQ